MMTPPPIWLAETANRVAAQFHCAEVLAPVGCHYFRDKGRDVWEVTVFVSGTETLGGEHDGKRTCSRFSVNLAGVHALFSEIHEFSWQAVSMGEADDLGPHLSIEGVIGGHTVWLRITAHPPEPFEPGRIADVCDRRFHDLW